MRCLWVVVGAVLSWVAAAGPAAAAADTDVFLLEVEGPITPVVSDYIADGIEEAAERSVPVIVRLDTPGGLDVSMREIVQSLDRKSTRLNSSHVKISYAVFCLKKKKLVLQHDKTQENGERLENMA